MESLNQVKSSKNKKFINYRLLESINLSLVVPVFNESGSLNYFINKINTTFQDNKSVQVEIIFINDGSNDGTLNALFKIQEKYSNIKIIDFSRNFGKEAAITAGLENAKGHVVVPIDVDLQDPPELIPKMIDLWREGYEVVLARRINRESDSLIKKISAQLFYKVINVISNIKIPNNVGDYRLIDRNVVDVILELPESCRFMKGLFSWVGFSTVYIDYKRQKRISGKTKFNSWKLWNFAIEGITSFSTHPLRIWTYLGLIVSFMSFLFAGIISIKVIIFGIDVPGYASIITAIIFFGGLQLIGIGIIGEYLGRAYIETKRRPVYIVRNIYDYE